MPLNHQRPSRAHISTGWLNDDSLDDDALHLTFYSWMRAINFHRLTKNKCFIQNQNIFNNWTPWSCQAYFKRIVTQFEIVALINALTSFKHWNFVIFSAMQWKWNNRLSFASLFYSLGGDSIDCLMHFLVRGNRTSSSTHPFHLESFSILFPCQIAWNSFVLFSAWIEYKPKFRNIFFTCINLNSIHFPCHMKYHQFGGG